MILPVVLAHSFIPDGVGTQCVVMGCWGWVDDPRHLHHTRSGPAPIVLPVVGRPCPAARRGKMPV
jgi:hypothetical protein